MWRLKTKESWYHNPVLTSKEDMTYLRQLETIWKVQDASKKWVTYKLQPHQVEWHLQDVALKEHLAKNRLVVKSRNTSLTTSSLISNLMAVPKWPEQVIPFIRMNITRANDLIAEVKKLIKHMSPIELPNGQLYPFDPTQVDMKATGSIKFPNDVEFRAFPATSDAAEVIRGLRIVGSAGLLDEVNFMRYFNDIFTASRDTESGQVDGKRIFQLNIGTTLKGVDTPFYNFYRQLQKKSSTNMKIFSWPVFEPTLFNPEQNIFKQQVVPIAYWHSVESLEDKRVQNITTFMEEFMCQPSEKGDAFYKLGQILDCANDKLSMMSAKLLKTESETLKDGREMTYYHFSIPVPLNPNGKFFVGIDVASVNDYFVITIFENVNPDGQPKYVQRFLHYEREVELPYMEQLCHSILAKWPFVQCAIDANGMGFQLAQFLMSKFGSRIKPIRGSKLSEYGSGNNNVKGIEKRQSIPLNEFIHTNQKRLIMNSQVELFNDELQLIHYTQWDNNFKAISTQEFGHGDIAIANGYALLPINYKSSKRQTGILFNQHRNVVSSERLQKNKIDADWGD